MGAAKTNHAVVIAGGNPQRAAEEVEVEHDDDHVAAVDPGEARRDGLARARRRPRALDLLGVRPGGGELDRIGRGPKRKCEIVTAPDFFESYTK